MKITVLAIGKKHDPKLVSAIEDYSRRLSHYTTFEWKLVESKLSSGMTEDSIKQAESEVLKSALPANCFSTLLDETGERIHSLQFSQVIQTCRNQGVKHIAFIIGGAYGVSNELKQSVDRTIRLSDLVFPHQLVRLVLIEQLYRAHTILAGEKYHHI